MRSRARRVFLTAFVSSVLSLTAGADDWAVIDGDQGLVIRPVLGCRSLNDLSPIANAADANRSVLAQTAVRLGRCTRLTANTFFVSVSQGQGVIQVRTAEHGRLWIATASRIPDLAGLQLQGTLLPEPEPASQPSFTAEERRGIEKVLSVKETVLGLAGRARIGGRSHVQGRSHIRGARNEDWPDDEDSDDTRRKSCWCNNGSHMMTHRSCDQACGVHGSSGKSGVAEDGYCYFHGERIDCQRAGELIWNEKARRY